jgi:ubiquinone/menaquinone biosynthesis C-methylase UbiE
VSAMKSSARKPDAEIRDWNRSVTSYFEDCLPQYRSRWMNNDDLAMHMGYWDSATSSHSQSLVNMNREMAERIKPTSSDRVLDAGCGVGGSSIWLAKTYGTRVTGINLHTRQLELARGFARERGLASQVTFLQQDFHYMGFQDESFDIVWAQEAVAHSPEKELFFAEAYRVLRKGGRLVMEEGLRFSRPYPERDENLLQRWLAGWAVPDLATGLEYVDWAKQAGFSDVKLDDVTPNGRPSLRRLYLAGTILYPRAVYRRMRGHGLELRMKNLEGARLQWRAMNRGLWLLGILSGRKDPGEGC